MKRKKEMYVVASKKYRDIFIDIFTLAQAEKFIKQDLDPKSSYSIYKLVRIK